jgi:hypothetical protein
MKSFPAIFVETKIRCLQMSDEPLVEADLQIFAGSVDVSLCILLLYLSDGKCVTVILLLSFIYFHNEPMVLRFRELGAWKLLFSIWVEPNLLRIK